MAKLPIPSRTPFFTKDTLSHEWAGFFTDIQKSPFVDAAYEKRWTYGSAAPTTGTWRVGDICWNNAPASTEYMGWVCVTAGTPGTWKGFGTIA